MKILLLTRTGVACGLAQRLAQEDHEVEVYSDLLNLVKTGNNLYQISTNLWKSVQECKFIISDDGNWPALYKRAKTYNKPIIGCHPITDMFNSDVLREYDVGVRLGVNFPQSELYDDVLGMQPRILEGKKRRYYVKHDRKVWPCTRPEWLAWAMYQMPVGQKVLLQEEVLGHDVSVVGWFNGLNWVKPFFYATPKSDRIGGVVMLAAKQPSRLFNQSLLPLAKWLKVLDYKGPVTANLIVSKEAGKTNVYVRSFYAGITAPCVFAMVEGLKDLPLGDFLNSLAFGTEREVPITLDYLVSVEVFNKEPDMQGAPVLGINEDNLRHAFLHGVYTDSGSYMISDECARVYTAAARGRDLKEAAQRVYRTIDEVQFPRMYYISNLVGQAELTLNKLKLWNAA